MQCNMYIPSTLCNNAAYKAFGTLLILLLRLLLHYSLQHEAMREMLHKVSHNLLHPLTSVL